MHAARRPGGASTHAAFSASIAALAEAAACGSSERVAMVVVRGLVDAFGATAAAMYRLRDGALVRVAARGPVTFADALRHEGRARRPQESGTYARLAPPRRCPGGDWSALLASAGRVVGELHARFADDERASRDDLASFVTLAAVVYARALDEAEPAPALDVHRYAQRVRMAAHELQQPLNAIGLFAEVVARAGADERPGAMARLLANVRKMARAVEDFRDVALSEAGSLALHRVPTDLAALVTGVLARASTPDVRYSLQRRRAVPRMSLDADRIERALHALFAFAGAHGAGREVVLDRVATEARVAIACATVPPEDHDDPRLHLCRAIAAAHGGRIVIDAGDPAGTSLQILLPIDVGRIP